MFVTCRGTGEPASALPVGSVTTEHGPAGISVTVTRASTSRRSARSASKSAATDATRDLHEPDERTNHVHVPRDEWELMPTHPN